MSLITDHSVVKHRAATHPREEACTEVEIKLLISRVSPSAAGRSSKKKRPQVAATRSASPVTRHACAFPRNVTPYKHRAAGDTVTSRERAVRGHLKKAWVGLVMSTVVIAQHATADSPRARTPPAVLLEEQRKKIEIISKVASAAGAFYVIYHNIKCRLIVKGKKEKECEKNKFANYFHREPAEN